MKTQTQIAGHPTEAPSATQAVNNGSRGPIHPSLNGKVQAPYDPTLTGEALPCGPDPAARVTFQAAHAFQGVVERAMKLPPDAAAFELECLRDLILPHPGMKEEARILAMIVQRQQDLTFSRASLEEVVSIQRDLWDALEILSDGRVMTYARNIRERGIGVEALEGIPPFEVAQA